MKTLLTIFALVVLAYGETDDDLSATEIFGTARIATKRCGNKQFFIGTNKMNLLGAMGNCRTKGMHLATIADKNEHDCLSALARALRIDHIDMWTSGSNHGDSSRVIWLTNGKPITYNGWYRACPSCNRESNQCVRLDRQYDYYTYQYWRFNYADCHNELYYVCEKSDDSC